MAGSQAAGIVVGVDGTPASREALVFALREGALRGSAVEVVTAWAFEGPYDGQLTQDLIGHARRNAERAQDEAITAALTTVAAPPLLSRTVVEGAAGPELLRVAGAAEYLVVGHGHKNIAQRTLLGSVSRHCVQHAPIPVLVVPEGATTSGQATQAATPATAAV
ncbi:MAG: universal stress protein [Actinomycetota bacterium]|nr:universal stress protein [Actinomycetota bacterium]